MHDPLINDIEEVITVPRRLVSIVSTYIIDQQSNKEGQRSQEFLVASGSEPDCSKAVKILSERLATIEFTKRLHTKYGCQLKEACATLEYVSLKRSDCPHDEVYDVICYMVIVTEVPIDIAS